MVYFAYFHSITEYGIIFWAKSTNICHVCTLQQRIIRIISGVEDKNLCRNVFKELGILHVQCQYILSLVFVMDNQKNFQTNLFVYRLDTRNKNHLYLPIANLWCFQRSVSYSAMKMFKIVHHIILRIIGMTWCSLNLYYMNILFFIHFIYLQNFLSIIEIIIIIIIIIIYI